MLRSQCLYSDTSNEIALHTSHLITSLKLYWIERSLAHISLICVITCCCVFLWRLLVSFGELVVRLVILLPGPTGMPGPKRRGPQVCPVDVA